MSARARQRRNRSRGSVGKKIMVGFAVLLGVFAAGLGGAAVWVLDVANSAPSIDTLKPADSGELSEVFDAKGNSLGYVQNEILREPAELESIPEVLQQATIAIEDESFYEHGGVDYAAIVRAGLENFEAGEVRQGASTITQQLVRNLYIEDPEDTVERKIIEAKMAQEYEDEYSKDEILEAYLNTAAYGTNEGRTAVGVKAAAEVFFDKPINELGVKEAALLAGLPQAPTTYNPFLNEKGATERRNQVLDALAKEGYIPQAQADKLKGEGLGLQRGEEYIQRDEEYFFDFVQQELIDRYGLNTVRNGGLEVYSTLEPDLQAAAEQAIANNQLAAPAAHALVSTRTETGEVIAMASSQTYETSQFNLAAQGKRQPGSSFKAFVLTEAVNQGIDPDSTTYPGPESITLYPYGEYGEAWQVSGGGPGLLRQATANSVNTVFAQLGIDVGPENFAQMAKKLGITSHLDGLAAEALGGTTECCTVLEMSNAYATIANGGVHHDPTAIRKVVFPDGEVDKPDLEGERVISDGVAYTVADVMKGTLEFGTAAGYGIGCPASGKTGTTELQSDAWFVGYTPHISTAVWTGNPDIRSPLPGYGADLSAPIWNDYMSVAASEPCDDFPAAEDPAELSSFYSDQTASSDTSDYSTTDPATGAPAPTTTEPAITDEDGDGYDDGAYAPGADQEPAPTPDN